MVKHNTKQIHIYYFNFPVQISLSLCEKYLIS